MSHWIKPPLGAQMYAGHTLAIGLVGFWLFNEGSGDIHNDALGNNHGALTVGGSSSWAASKFGVGRSFNGTDQNLRWPDGGPTDISGANARITLYAWLRLDSVDLDRHILNKYLASTGKRGYQQYHRNDEHIIRFTLSPDGTANTSLDSDGTIIEDGGFHQIVSTSDNVYMRTYIDGKLECTPQAYSSGIHNNDQDFRIGSNPTGYWWNGIIDHCAVWNRALSAGEIEFLYLNPFCMFEEEI